MNNFYNLTLLKMHFLSDIYKNHKNTVNRQELSEEFSYNNLFKNLNLKKVSFTLDKDVLLSFDENQLNDFTKYIEKKYNLSYDLDSLKNISSTKKTPVKTYHIVSQEEINIARSDAQLNPAAQDKYRNEELLKINKQKKLEHFFDMNFDYKNKKIVSLDFEFIPGVLDKFSFKNIFELGISVQDGSNINSYHYIVEENSNLKEGKKRELQSSFNFGKSEYVSFKDLNEIIQKHIDNNELLIFHEHSYDLSILDSNNINYDIKNVKDTQYIYSKHFRKPEEEQSKTLKKLLDDHNIIYKNLHNAGNDSRFTLMLFKSMCKDYQSLKRKNNLKNN